MVSLNYESFNSYAGSVGEILGVQFFMAGFLFLICFVMIRRQTIFPKWVAYSGLVTTALLAGSIVELFGIDSGMLIMVNGTILHVWFLAVGVFLIRYKSGGRVQ